LTFKGENCNLS